MTIPSERERVTAPSGYGIKLATRIISHYTEALVTSRAQGGNRSEWDLLEVGIIDAQSALDSGNPQMIAWAFFDLGRVAHRLEIESKEEMEELEKLAEGARKSRSKIMIRNHNKKIAKIYVHAFAQHEWDNEGELKTRIGEMTQIVWSRLLDDHERGEIGERIVKALPDRPEGLKPWLREIAPDSAKRPGRPKK